MKSNIVIVLILVIQKNTIFALTIMMMNINLWWLLLRIGYFFSTHTDKIFQWKLKIVLSRIVKYRLDVILKNIEITKIVDKSDAKAFYIRYYDHLASYITQILYGYFAPKEKLNSKLKFSQTELLSNAINEGRNVFIIGSHLGNWEWSSILLPLHIPCKVVAVYKPLSNKSLDQIMIKCRSRFGLILSPMAQVVKLLANKKKEVATYIFISDQRPSPDTKGELVNFFNIKTTFNHGAFKLAKRYDAVLFYQEIIPSAVDTYTVKFTKMEENEGTQVYANLLETTIRNYPTYWLWSHNRWK